MSAAELVQEIKRLGNADRLMIIEAATALVREEFIAQEAHRRDVVAQRLRAAAVEAKGIYEPGGELTEWNVLDGEEIFDDPAHADKG